MIELSVDASGCIGIAAIIASLASLVWAFRRHPRGARRFGAPR
jgi:hypothetical protein